MKRFHARLAQRPRRGPVVGGPAARKIASTLNMRRLSRNANPCQIATCVWAVRDTVPQRCGTERDKKSCPGRVSAP